jgi:aminoglycoside phosphotransferase (APT) family kinase protein
MMKMHDGEIFSDAGLLKLLLEEQFPELAGRPIRAVRSTGTMHRIYRIGDDLCARLPRLDNAAPELATERHWLPKLAPQLPLRIPVPVDEGRPSDEYPLPWAIYEWIEGKPYDQNLIEDEDQSASALAQFVLQLRQIAPDAEAQRAGRRPLSEFDAGTREAIEASGDYLNRNAATAAWLRALEAPSWTGTPVWIHADLLRPNLLVHDGRLAAVIDFGAAGIGDPAADVIAAWTVFGPAGRAVYREALEVDDGTWERARGYALHQAALIIPYYRQSNPGFVELARRTVQQVLLEG